MVRIYWEQVLLALEDITIKAPVDHFSEHDANELNKAAQRIRAKLKEKHEKTEQKGPDFDC